MADQWIEAGTALRVFGNAKAICERCHAGLIRSRAQSFQRQDVEKLDVEVPREFWWAEGHEALEQNWDTGDFSTWIDSKIHLRAFGVRFALDDLLKLIPFEQQPATRRRLSVAGNPEWAAARDARRFAYETAGLQPRSAGEAVVEHCRLGFIVARAVEMRWARGRHPDDWTVEEREWDIPTWFWENLVAPDGSTQNWERGVFAGQGKGLQGYGWMTLNGVHFLRSSLEVLLPSAPAQTTEKRGDERPKPNLPEAELERWWEKLAPVRDGLTQNQLHAVAKADHPQHAVSRERIRALAEGRRPGPKT